jgi:hypothetical protein
LPDGAGEYDGKAWPARELERFVLFFIASNFPDWAIL